MGIGFKRLAIVFVAGFVGACGDGDSASPEEIANALADKMEIAGAVRREGNLVASSPLPKRPVVITPEPIKLAVAGQSVQVPLSIDVADSTALRLMLIKIVGADSVFELGLASKAGVRPKARVSVALDVALPLTFVGQRLCMDIQVLDLVNRASEPQRVCLVVDRNDAIAPIVANAGPRLMLEAGASRVLQGQGSGVGGSALVSFQWRQISGPPAELAGQNTAVLQIRTPSVSQPAEVVLELTVRDEQGNVASDQTVITVVPQPVENRPPVVEAGASQTLISGASLTLPGDATDLEGPLATVLWRQLQGPVGSISNANQLEAVFQAPNVASDTPVQLLLAVTDEAGLESADTLDILVVPLRPDTAPDDGQLRADAGEDQFAISAETVQLDGRGSRPALANALSYRWTQVGGEAVDVAGGNTDVATFVAPRVSTQTLLRFRLTVRDRNGEALADSVDVFISPSQPNQLRANAGLDQTVNGGQIIRLDGRGSSSPNGTITSINWRQVSGPDVDLSGSNTAQPSALAPAATATAQDLVFALTVRDSQGASASDSVMVSVRAAEPNQAPIASAGADRTVSSGTQVGLNGGGSVDPDGSINSFLWEQLTGPTVVLNNATTATPSFFSPQVSSPTALTIRVTVTDNDGAQANDAVTIGVLPASSPPPAGTWNESDWDGASWQ